MTTGAIALLRAEHEEIETLFESLRITRSAARRSQLLDRICHAIRLHYTIETGVFFPRYADAAGNSAILDEVGAEYAAVISLVNELTHALPGTARVNENTLKLRARVGQHIDAAEVADGVFARAHALPIDWPALERDLAARRSELSGTMPAHPAPESGARMGATLGNGRVRQATGREEPASPSVPNHPDRSGGISQAS